MQFAVVAASSLATPFPEREFESVANMIIGSLPSPIPATPQLAPVLRLGDVAKPIINSEVPTVNTIQ